MKQKEEKLGVTRGSDNIFHDFDHADGELRYLKCQLAVEIIGVLDENVWSVRPAQKEMTFDAETSLESEMRTLRGSHSTKWLECWRR